MSYPTLAVIIELYAILHFFDRDSRLSLLYFSRHA